MWKIQVIATNLSRNILHQKLFKFSKLASNTMILIYTQDSDHDLLNPRID